MGPLAFHVRILWKLIGGVCLGMPCSVQNRWTSLPDGLQPRKWSLQGPAVWAGASCRPQRGSLMPCEASATTRVGEWKLTDRQRA